MKIKIFKDEYLFSEQGTHVCNEQGFAIKASEDIECEVSDEHADRVKELLKIERLNRGLDEEGKPIPSLSVSVEESIIIEQPAVFAEE